MPWGGGYETPEDLAAYQEWYKQQQGGNRPEDMERFLQGDTLKRWDPYLERTGDYAGKYRSSRGAEGYFDKPTECPPGTGPSGPSESDPCVPNAPGGFGGRPGGYTGGGPGDEMMFNSGGGGGWWGGGGPGGAPVFTPPTYESVMADPGYQFRLREGNRAIQGSAAAKGLLRTGGTLKDLLGYSQDLASQEYGNAYGRGLQEWQTRFQPWQTAGGWDLSRWTTGQNAALQKYLQREGNIYGLLNPSMPAY